MKLQAARDRFLEYCREEQGLAVHTLRAYQSDLADYFRYAKDADLGDCNEASIRHYLSSLGQQRGLRPTTIKRRLACLRRFFKWSANRGLVDRNPLLVCEIRIPLPKRLPRCLNQQEIDCLLSQVQRDYRRASCSEDHRERQAAFNTLVTVELLLATGIRISELASIRIGDMDLQTGAICIRGKGNRERRAFIVSKSLCALLDEHFGPRRESRPASDALLTSASGQPATAQYLRRLVTRAGRQAKLRRRVTPHMLRHTAATQLLNRGLDIRHVQRLLGHASISTTELYTHVADDDLRRALERAIGE